MMMKNTVMMVMMISLMVVTDEDHCTVCLHRVVILVNVRIAHRSISHWVMRTPIGTRITEQIFSFPDKTADVNFAVRCRLHFQWWQY